MKGQVMDYHPPATYLGDAVYASTDGTLIWLHLNDHRSKPVLALEPDVLWALCQYGKNLGWIKSFERA